MPLILKQTAPHILISLFVAPIMVTMFAWGNNKISENGETSAKNSAKIPHIVKTMDQIHQGQMATNSKMDSVLVIMYEDRSRISKLEVIADNCKEAISDCKEKNNVTNP